jgi:hypothetical protein
MKRERARTAWAMAAVMRVAGDKEGNGEKAMKMAKRVAGERTATMVVGKGMATATKRAMTTKTREAGEEEENGKVGKTDDNGKEDGDGSDNDDNQNNVNKSDNNDNHDGYACSNGCKGGVINNGADISIVFAISGIGISPVNPPQIMHTPPGGEGKRHGWKWQDICGRGRERDLNLMAKSSKNVITHFLVFPASKN